MIFTKLKESDFVKNIATLLSGNIIGYAINMCFLPIISRIFTTSNIGEYDLVISSASIIITILQMSLLLVIMIPKKDSVASRICKIILYITLIGSALIIGILMAISPRFKIFELSFSYNSSLILLMIYICSINLNNIYYSYTNRKKVYSALFWNPIINAISNGLLSVIFGILGWGAVGYLLGTISANIITVFHMKRYVNPFFSKTNLKELIETLHEYKEYPLIQLPAVLIETISLQIPIQFLGNMFDASILGGYTMACKLLSVPVSLLATPINRVYYRTLVEKSNCGEPLGDFAYQMVNKNIKIAIIPIALLMIFGTEITTLFLGNEWSVSGQYILISGMMYVLQYCNVCISGTFIATKNQKIALGYSLGTCILMIVVFMGASILNLSVINTIIVYTVVSCIGKSISLMLCVYCTHGDVKKITKFILKWCLGGSGLIYLIYVIKGVIWR